MRNTLLYSLFLCLFSVFLALPAQATTTKEGTRDGDQIGMVTGGLTGTYIRIGNDIASVSKEYGVNINVKESRGSIDNIKRINSTENAALGIVQSDLLGYLTRSRDPESQRIARNLRMLFPFYNEEIHVFAQKDIQNFSDLSGKRVVIGTEGSGHWLTSMNLFAMLDIKPAEMLRLSPTDAVVAVLRDRADAMIFVGGKPVKLFKNLEDLESIQAPEYRELLNNVHFVPIDDPRIFTEYGKSTLSADDYSFMKSSIPTASVTAVMVSYDFTGSTDYYKHRCAALGKVGYAIRSNADRLKKQGHPKWREVNLNATNVGLWKKDTCIESYQPTVRNTNASPLESELLKSISRRHNETPDQANAQ